MSQLSASAVTAFVFWTLTDIGLIFDQCRSAWLSEAARCALFLAVYNGVGAFTGFNVPANVVNVTYGLSLAMAGAMVAAGGGEQKGEKEKKKK